MWRKDWCTLYDGVVSDYSLFGQSVVTATLNTTDVELDKQYGQYLTSEDQQQRAHAVSLKLADTKPGGEAIPLAFPDINGQEISLASLKGKVVLIDLWATWCGLPQDGRTA